MPKAGEHYLSERKRRFVDEYLKTCDGWDLSTGRKKEAAVAAGYSDPRQCYRLLGRGGAVKCHAVYRYLCSLAPEGVTFEFVGKPIDTGRARQKANKAKRGIQSNQCYEIDYVQRWGVETDRAERGTIARGCTERDDAAFRCGW